MILNGEVTLPGDKSISHRALMLNAISNGKARIKNLLKSEDIFATMSILRACGIRIVEKENEVIVYGTGFEGLHAPKEPLDCQNSGTSARLFLGLFSGLNESYQLIGDDSLSNRPMYRVVKHLDKLNANIALTNNDFLPAIIHPTRIKGAEVFLDISSAQVKTAVILAALKTKETTIIHELSPSRNHTELMLQSLGCDLFVDDLTITVSGKNSLISRDIEIPGDLSSAAFFIVACLITPGSHIMIKNCGLNPTRTGLLYVLNQIQANYKIVNQKKGCNEIIGDIHITYENNLKPFTIDKELVPLLIDEIPVLTLLATQIKGTSIIKDAKELRVKESDRISTTTDALNKLGANVKEYPDGMIVTGMTPLKPNVVDTKNDHRISMMLKVARLLNPKMKILNEDCDKISYPQFLIDLDKLIK